MISIMLRAARSFELHERNTHSYHEQLGRVSADSLDGSQYFSLLCPFQAVVMSSMNELRDTSELLIKHYE